jgi:hypothetical protein
LIVLTFRQREIPLAFLRSANRAFDGIAGLERETADLRGRNIDIVRARQVVRIGRAHEAKSVLQDLDHTFADDFDFLCRKLLEDRKHQLLLAHYTSIFDLDRFCKRQKIGRSFVLELLKLHFLHGKSKFRY